MKRNLIGLCGLILALFLLIGCGNPLPVSTILWLPDGNGSIQFSTNDWHNWDTLFVNSYPSSLETPMTTVTVQVEKVSGALSAGFGLFFCAADLENFYRIMITADGYYTIQKKESGVYNPIIGWTTSSFINTGLGALNEISVTQTIPNNFTLTINGNVVVSFNDASFTGGEAGFVVYVWDQANERFPMAPADVRFKMTAPVAVP
ncbi:MAG: hypothetical protein JXD23_11880 [Spirochaetales bacterium]|nr:hypothetical protein [Spirochaetales bacterium]